MREFVTLFVALALFTASGCGKHAALPKLPQDATVLAFGDSLTFGTGARDDESYPSQLGALIGRKVVRAGVPGETSEAGLERLPGALDEHAPRLLILCHGGNDFLRKMGEESAAANVREMIRLARSRGIEVVLLATPKPGFGTSKVKFYEEIGKELPVPVEKDVLADVLGSCSLKSDLVHPNARGYEKIAEALADLLRDAGAI